MSPENVPAQSLLMLATQQRWRSMPEALAAGKNSQTLYQGSQQSQKVEWLLCSLLLLQLPLPARAFTSSILQVVDTCNLLTCCQVVASLRMMLCAVSGKNKKRRLGVAGTAAAGIVSVQCMKHTA